MRRSYMVIPGLLQAQKHWLEATTSFINNCHRQTSAIVFVGVHRGMNDTEFYWYFPPHRQRLPSHPTPLLSHFQHHQVNPLPSMGEGGSARAWDFTPPSHSFKQTCTTWKKPSLPMQWDRVLSGPSQACSGSSSSDRMMESEMDRYVVSSHYGVDTKKVLNKAEGLVAAAAAVSWCTEASKTWVIRVF